jgi:hypothetical protein
MTLWAWLILFTLFMAVGGVLAGMAVSTIVTALLDPTCSRGFCDAELFAPYTVLTMWVPTWAVAGVAALLIWRGGRTR